MKKNFYTILSLFVLILILLGMTFIFRKSIFKPKFKPISREEYVKKYLKKPDLPMAAASAKIDLKTTDKKTDNQTIDYSKLEVFIDYPSFVILNPDLAQNDYFRSLVISVNKDGIFNFGDLPAGRKVILIITDYDKIYKQKLVEVPSKDTDLGIIDIEQK